MSSSIKKERKKEEALDQMGKSGKGQNYIDETFKQLSSPYYLSPQGQKGHYCH